MLMTVQVFIPPGYTEASLEDKPFHIYDDEFYAIIGDNPTLTIIASSASDPLYHEAVTWWDANIPTDVSWSTTANSMASGIRRQTRSSSCRMRDPQLRARA
jgi:gluconolactonase